MTYELKNGLVMFDLLRDRADRECKQLRVASRSAGQTNANVERILNAPLRNLDRLGDLVQPGECKAGGDRGQADPHGERATACGYGDDRCDEFTRETVRATLSGDERIEWENRNSPLDGPWARKPVTAGGSDT